MDLLWLLETAVWLLAVAQVVPILATPFLRREYWLHPRRTIVLAGAVGVAGTLPLGVILRWPMARHVVAIGMAVVVAGVWWRARPAYGRRRRLPPGSLGIRQSIRAILDRRFYLDQADRFGPIFKMSQFGRPVVCVVGLKRCRAILVQHAASLAGAGFWRPFHRFIPLGLLRSMSAENHRAVAPVFRTTFRSLDLDRADPVLREIYRSAWARMAADSQRDPGGVNGQPYYQRAAVEAVGYLFYGLAPDDPRVDDLLEWMPVLLGPADLKQRWKAETPVALAAATRLLRQIQAGWAVESEDAFPSALRQLLAAHPAAIDDPTYTGNFIVISRIAYGDLHGLTKWIFQFLSQQPESLDPVRRGLEGRGGEGGVPDPASCIVMETLRLEQSEYIYRHVARTFEFEGLVIPRGWALRCCINESHRDPVAFDDPDRFRPDRFANRHYGLDEYAPFGLDSHGCMGADMAHAIGRLFVEELARGFDLRVMQNGPSDRGNRHRNHWLPSSLLRVVLTPRADMAAG